MASGRWDVVWRLLLVVALVASGVVEPTGLYGQGQDETATPSPDVGDASELSADTFLASPFSEFFRAGDYQRALDALEVLAQQFPGDALVTRYRAIVLDRLGRYAEALALYEKLLRQDPQHVPTHSFMGQTYLHMGNKEAAVREWEWVAAHSTHELYRRWSQQQLASLRAGKAVREPRRQRLYLFGDAGFEYDSNPLLKPNDKGVATEGNEKQAERFSFNVGLGYPVVLQPDARVDVLYTARQSLHTRSLDQVNFIGQEFALATSRRFDVWERDLTLGARYDVLMGLLDGDLFSLANRWLLSADARVTPRTRTYLYNRFTVANFGNDGSNPPQTSRDGFDYDMGATQYLYSKDFRQFLFANEEFGLGQARGGNFRRRSLSSRVGVHTPVPFIRRTDLDVSGGFQFGKYPDFSPLSSLDTTRREDTNWDLYSALTYYWTPRLATRAFYRYLNANNRNDIFQYDRHITGIQMLFTEYF